MSLNNPVVGMTRQQMLDELSAGRVVSHRGVVYTKAADLPAVLGFGDASREGPKWGGRWPGPGLILRPGKWFAPELRGDVASLVHPLDTIRLAPLWLNQPVTIDALGFVVTFAGSGNPRFQPMIYADDGNGFPGNLVLDGGLQAGDTAASLIVTLPQALSLGEGLYWVGGNSKGAASRPTLSSQTLQGSPYPLPSADTGFGGPTGSYSGYQALTSGSAAPQVFPASGFLSTSVPRVHLRTAA